ncbi:MAG: FAD/NAD(P)-binding oxidoreductase [Ignavibacteria bacterium GWA2_55_11]|nr:MAG: FAD/NAD(P)-binding oxidoreductase [Ignavibacteria bacterium GWA2_55_11]OGU44381.1 MAG: FAD/NAD(P)-binding oxidoreductase [Ignavibacteria bacterium GWC2_56_12]
MNAKQYDIVVVGAGVVGCAIAFELSRFNLRVALLDSRSDVGSVTSKANSAILHTGFDATSDTIESALVRKGYQRFHHWSSILGLPIEKVGGLLIAWDEEQLVSLPGIVEKAKKNGVTDLTVESPESVYALEPQLSPGALGGIRIPGESITCTFTAPLAFATTAVRNGVEWLKGTHVHRVHKMDTRHQLQTSRGIVDCRILINAAGLFSDEIDRMLGFDRFTVSPRKGEFVVFDKRARSLLSHIILPVPTKKTKGVLIAPTVYGNVLLGPTADNIQDKSDSSTTVEGLSNLMSKGTRLMPALLKMPITTTYAGLRAATENSDYQLFFEPQASYICVGGVRSTGMSSSLGIAEAVRERLPDFGITLEPKPGWIAHRMSNIAESFERPSQSSERIGLNPEYGRIVCHCEQVSLREIKQACSGPLPATNLDGIRRRTRAMLGRCQGFYCMANIVDICSNNLEMSAESLLGMADPKEKA